MKRIGLLLDPDPGHIYPVLGLAEALSNLDYKVYLLGLADIRKTVEKYRFEFYPVFEEIYPLGFIENYKLMQKQNSDAFILNNTVPRPHLISLMEGGLNKLISHLQLDLMIVLKSLAVEAMILKMLHPEMQLVFFTTWLRKADLTAKNDAIDVIRKLPEEISKAIVEFSAAKKVEDIVNSLDEISEIIPCPSEFDIPDPSRVYPNEIFHIGSMIRESLDESYVSSLQIPAGKKVIYMSFGSQTALFLDKITPIFKIVHDAVLAELGDDWLLLMSVGNEIGNLGLDSVSNQVVVKPWFPQIEVLKKANMVITHGGLGTIKECIENEIPMIVIPIIYDQFDNADRVVYHGLGLKLELHEVTGNTLVKSIKKIDNNDFFKSKLKSMKKTFDKYKKTHVGVIADLIMDKNS